MVLWWVPEESAGGNDRGGESFLAFSGISVQPVIFAGGNLSMEWGAAGYFRLPEFHDDNFHFTPELPSVRSADAFRIGWVVCGLSCGDGVRAG